MADVYIGKGNIATVNYMWCEGDREEWTPSFGAPMIEGSAPYNDHYDGAYNLGYYTANYPLNPKIHPMQRAGLKNVGVGDIVGLIKVPLDYFATFLNFKSTTADPRLEGMTVQLTCQKYTPNPDPDGDPIPAEDQYIEEALAAQGKDTPIEFDKPFNIMLSLLRVTGSGPVTGSANTTTGAITATAATTGYVQPMYSDPGEYFYVIGFKVLSLPTNTANTLSSTLKDAYLSVKLEAFDSAGYI